MMLKENRLLDEIEFLEVLSGKDLKQVNVWIERLLERLLRTDRFSTPEEPGGVLKSDVNDNQL